MEPSFGIDLVDRKASHIKVYTGFSAPIDWIGCSLEVRDQLRGERFVDLPYGYLFSPQPIRASSRGMARAGAINMPSMRKSTAATSQSISLTMGRTPSRRRPSSSPTQIDAEPSVSGEEFPAVSEPALLRSNTAGSLASFSGEVSRLGHLTGDGKDGRVIVARLVTTNPRPKEEQRAMAGVIHGALRAAIEAAAPSYWWQCCVLFGPFDKADYLKTDSRG